MSHPQLRIGIPILGTAEWMGGVYYIVHLVKTLRRLPDAERPKLFLVVEKMNVPALPLHAEALALVDGVIQLGFHAPLPDCPHTPSVARNFDDLFRQIDFYYPRNSAVVPGHPVATWIPDFQHIHLPQFFSDQERARRDRLYQRIAEQARLLVLSSESARADWNRLFPDAETVTRILHFHTVPEDDWFVPDPQATAAAHELPARYLICCNQFWVHKGHRSLFHAMAKLRDAGEEITLVCTGASSDWRAQDHFANLEKELDALNLTDRVRLLGLLPRAEQIALIRRSVAVVQPSLFEGWSTIVEDARLLGKTIFLSDLDVHREQNPPGAIFFRTDDAAHMAETIGAHVSGLQPGPDPTAEAAARSHGETLLIETARHLCAIASESQYIFDRKPVEMPSRLFEMLHKPITLPTETTPAQPDPSATPQATREDKHWPRITLVTPSMNQAAFLEACIQSVLSQDYPNLEYMILDGGSNDASAEIINQYEDQLAYWRSEPDAGHYAAIAEGFQRGTGEILCWLNADDKLHAGALKLVADVFTARPDVDWIVGRPTVWNEDGSVQFILKKLPVWNRAMYLQGRIGPPHIQQESCFWRRRLWDAAGGGFEMDLKLAGDVELWARFFRHAPLHTVDALLGGNRAHPAQATASRMEEYNREAARVIEREQALVANESDTPLLPPPPVITPAEIAETTDRRITPAIFDRFVYSRRGQEPYFRNYARALYGKDIDLDGADLKAYQDLLVYAFIRDNIPPGAKLLEIGGGDSRVLRALHNDYECWNIDRFEGVGTGPTRVPDRPYRIVLDYMGNGNQELPPQHFDLVFSISALEHVPQEKTRFQSICDDIDRVLKPGGWSLHTFDVNLGGAGWMTAFVPYLMERYPTPHPFVPLDVAQHDPATRVLTPEAFARYWAKATGQPYEQAGRVASYQVLWQQPALAQGGGTATPAQENREILWQRYRANPDDPNVTRQLIAAEEKHLDNLLAQSEIVDGGYAKNDYRLSVLVSTYASEAFMRECLDDLTGQTIADALEILIIDAASPENERAIVEAYQQRHDNIRYVRTPERIGIYEAWNLAIRLASAPYLTPFSTNDRHRENGLEMLLHALETHPNVALVYGDSRLTNRPHETFDTCSGDKAFAFPHPYRHEDLRKQCLVGPHPVWRASLHGEIGYFDPSYVALGDQDFWHRIARKHELLHITEETGMAWITPDALSGGEVRKEEWRRVAETYNRLPPPQRGIVLPAFDHVPPPRTAAPSARPPEEIGLGGVPLDPEAVRRQTTFGAAPPVSAQASPASPSAPEAKDRSRAFGSSGGLDATAQFRIGSGAPGLYTQSPPPTPSPRAAGPAPASPPGTTQEAYQQVKTLATAGRFSEAIAALESLLAQHPNEPVLHNDLGVLLIQQNDTDRARHHLERAVDLHPGQANARKNLGDLEMGQKRFDAALTQYAAAAEREPGDTECLLKAAHACACLKRGAEAKAYLDRVLAIDPQNRDARDALAAMQRPASSKPTSKSKSKKQKKRARSKNRKRRKK